MLNAESGELISAPSLPNESLLTSTVVVPLSSSVDSGGATSDPLQDIPTPALESLAPQQQQPGVVIVGGGLEAMPPTSSAGTPIVNAAAVGSATTNNLRRPLLVQVCSAPPPPLSASNTK